jgi:hypothetical protein
MQDSIAILLSQKMLERFNFTVFNHFSTGKQHIRQLPGEVILFYFPDSSGIAIEQRTKICLD